MKLAKKEAKPKEPKEPKAEKKTEKKPAAKKEEKPAAKVCHCLVVLSSSPLTLLS